jgi:hypothetical protein
MAISLFSTSDNSQQEVISLVGDSELQSLWKPIIEREGLYTLDYIVSAGLSIDNDNFREVIDELRVLLNKINLNREFVDDIGNPVFRIQRVLDILSKWGPGCGAKLYIG